MTTDIAAPAGYAATFERASFRDTSSVGRVVLRDQDRADLLNRLSTNDILSLQPGQGLRTVLTTPIGRIIDVLTVCALPEHLLLLATPGHGPALARYVGKNIFLNDRVSIEDITPNTRQFQIAGSEAARIAEAICGDAAVAALPRFHAHQFNYSGAPALFVRELPLGRATFALIVGAEQAVSVATLLQEHGAAPLSEQAYELLRVEHGYARFGHELSKDYIPLETGLADAISFKKGCYVGQEIIARMDSRKRLAKRLMGLRLSAPVAAPAKLEAEGKEAGDLTSAVVSPRFGPIALAYVRSAYAQPGARIGIAGSALTGELVELPFC
jgi:aminomethyltransferase